MHFVKSTFVFVCASALLSTAACGELRKPKGSGATHGAGRSGSGGSNGVSGGAALGNADSGEGGMPPEALEQFANSRMRQDWRLRIRSTMLVVE